MERKLIANYLVPDDEVWVSPATWERPFSFKAKESTITDTQQLKAEIRAICIELECTSHDKFDCGMYHALRGRLRELSAI